MARRKIPQQLIPLAVIVVLLVAGLIVVRVILVPKSFGKYGHYRADAVEEIASHRVVYAGFQACAECHDDIVATKQASKHKGVTCEVCHDTASQHITAPDQFTPIAPRGRGFCPLCHAYNPARPTGFPQINPEVHNPGKACMTCHNPHNPLLPHTPEECSACHRDVASVKNVSNHATVPCIKCHVVPPDHLTNPTFVRAEKPTSKETCGQCHAKNADSPAEIPRVDLASHGGRYLCWDCHYPHYPEAN